MRPGEENVTSLGSLSRLAPRRNFRVWYPGFLHRPLCRHRLSRPVSCFLTVQWCRPSLSPPMSSPAPVSVCLFLTQPFLTPETPPNIQCSLRRLPWPLSYGVGCDGLDPGRGQWSLGEGNAVKDHRSLARLTQGSRRSRFPALRIQRGGLSLGPGVGLFRWAGHRLYQTG